MTLLAERSFLPDLDAIPMTTWRVGFVVENATRIKGLGQVNSTGSDPCL
jgi:hypothetical protein